MLSKPAVLIISVVVFIYVRSIARWRTRTRGRLMPPGPKGLPIIGNLFNIPQYKPWFAYRNLCAKFGDFIHLRVFGQSIVVLGSPSVIFEYLDKHSANTSDRMQSPIAEVTGQSLNLGFMPYGQWWRRHRRAFWQHFNREAAVRYCPTQRTYAHRFLRKLLDDPAELKSHLRYTFAGTVMKIIYNIDIERASEDYLSIVEEALEVFEGLNSGVYLVQFLPFLRHIPPWFPGASSQKLFAKWRAAANRLKDVPYYHAKALIEQNSDRETSQSVAGQLISELGNNQRSLEEEEEVIKNVGAVVIEAGADTTFSTLQTVFLAMSLYPNVLKKAQAELDAIVGPHRLPDFDDQESLVYINAIVKESLRWQNVVPIGIPHTTTADDEFHGYFIPAGTVLFPNVWACMHDPEVYEAPDDFRPERFIRDGQIDTAVRDPTAFVFGFGRRICPGRHFAEASLFINIASVLHVFDITPPVGEDGLQIAIEPAQTSGVLSYPEDCRCTIKPRSAAAEALIRDHTSFVGEETT